MSNTIFYIKALIGVALIPLVFTACNRATTTETAAPAPATPAVSQESASPAPSSPVPPSPTTAPLAASVNGVGITLEEYQSELALYQAALGTELTPEDEQRVRYNERRTTGVLPLPVVGTRASRGPTRHRKSDGCFMPVIR